MRFKLFTFLVASDQILKLLALKYSQPAFNSGIAFGLGESVPTLAILIVFLVLFISVYRSKSGSGEMFLLAGGAGNILDRLIHGKITDWIKFGNLRFNLADGYIVAGITIIIINALIRSLVNKSINPLIH